jgi:hypothetical protein
LKYFWNTLACLAFFAALYFVAQPYSSLVKDFSSNPAATQPSAAQFTGAHPITLAASEPAFILELLKIALTTCAFITALYALYSKDARLRASGELLFFSLMFFIGSTFLLVVAIVMTKANPTGTRELASTGFVTYTAILMYVAGVASLIFMVFLPTYNQLYNLKTNKPIRNLKPIRWIRVKLGWDKKRYELHVKPRAAGEFLSILSGILSANEVDQLRRGGAILLTGVPTLRYLEPISQLVLERMNLKETVNYVCTHRPPGELWTALAAIGAQDFRSAFVFIDAYSPNFAFTDDIHRDRLEQLGGKGVKRVCAKSLAGLHTATNLAFNLIKGIAVQAGTPEERAPMLMIYDHTSVLCDLESIEQFAVFWRHVIPSERAYGMLTVIIEDDATPKPRTDVLRQLVDVVIKLALEVAPESNNVTLKLVKE